MIAFAAFIIVAVDAFHREGGEATADRSSGTGGYPLIAESLLPIVLDLSSENGRAELGVSSFDDEVFAVNGDEPGAARLNTRAWDDALEALDALE